MSTTAKGYVDTEYLDMAAANTQLSAMKQLTYERMHLQPGQRVLDVGCGPGTDTIPLARYVGPSGQVVGVDYDPEMIAEAEERALRAGVSAWVKHERADATALPFAANYFDACRSERVLPHLLDPAKALSEVARVTKPGGRVVVFDPDGGSVSMDANNIESERRLVRVFAEHLINNGYVGRRLYRLFKEQGLAEVSVQVCGFHCTDYGLARQIWIMDRVEREALTLGVVTAQELDQLHAYWEKANTEGVYFASVHGILVSGQLPMNKGN
jgi:ubiquinone/menaquinone biosynthesis C-methylase UbiE